MKKLLTTLTAIALSVAVVSTVDARKVTQRVAGPKKATKSDARAMTAATKQVTDVKAPKEDRDAALDEIIAIFQENPDELQLAQLFILRKQKMNEVEAKKEEIAAMNVGWFDFNNVDYKEAKGELATLMIELKNLNKEISDQARVVGPEMSRAVKFAIGGAIAAAGLIAIDAYLGSNIRKAAMEKGGALLTAAGAYVEPAYTRAREAVGAAGERVREFGAQVGRTYRAYAPEVLGGETPAPDAQ